MSNYSKLQPLTTLSSGAKGEFPLLGYGTYGGKDSANELASAIEHAIDAGYRHFDLAEIYNNQKELGEQFKRIIDSKKVKREELFITTKVWNTNHDPKNVLASFERSLKDLQMDYVDLLLVHWPLAWKHSTLDLSQPGAGCPIENGLLQYENVSLLNTWRAFEQLQESGRVRHIGVSNYNVGLLQDLVLYAKIKPAVVQVELHPYLPQFGLLQFAKAHGIVLTAYTPLGRPDKAHKTDRILLQDDVILKIAKDHNVEPANVVLRWLIDHGIAAIPKSKTQSRIESNFKKTIDLKLSKDEIKLIDKIHDNSFIRYNQMNLVTGEQSTGGETLYESFI